LWYCLKVACSLQLQNLLYMRSVVLSSQATLCRGDPPHYMQQIYSHGQITVSVKNKFKSLVIIGHWLFLFCRVAKYGKVFGAYILSQPMVYLADADLIKQITTKVNKLISWGCFINDWHRYTYTLCKQFWI